MSLWHKPVDQIAFADIDAFCRLSLPEGARLDYKGLSIPKNLDKAIAGFANTLGGLIILGVDADQKNNKPIWPPVAGMKMVDGLQEQVLQIASEAIVPAAPVEVSPVIQNPNRTGECFVIVRVIQSRTAPHAIEKNRHVYVYERSASRSDPFELADIDRIEHLLRQRQKLIDGREANLGANIEKARRFLKNSVCPIRWVSIAPVFPWRAINDRDKCVSFFQLDHVQQSICPNIHWSTQNAVDGAFAVGKTQVSQDPTPIQVAVASVQEHGTLFGMAYGLEALYDNDTLLKGVPDLPKGKRWMRLDGIESMSRGMLEAAGRFYSKCHHEPGEVMLTIGVSNAQGIFMSDPTKGTKSRHPFIDNEYRFECVVRNPDSAEERTAVINGIRDEVVFSFNAASDLN